MKLKTKIILLVLFICIVILAFPNKSNASDVQSAVWFMDDFNITQLPGEGSHSGTQNFDVYGIKNGEIKAPFDCKVVAYYPALESGNTVVIESVNPVRYANGTIEYMSMAFAHGNDISNCISAYQNETIIKQGETFYHQGNYGIWNGNSVNTHCHVTCLTGKYSEQNARHENLWSATSEAGIGYSPYNIDPREALVIPNDIEIYQTLGMSFRFKIILNKNILEWGANPNIAYYKLKGTKDGNPILGEKITTSSYDVGKLGGGNLKLYVEAYNGNDEAVTRSGEITIEPVDDFVYFDAEIQPYKPSTLVWNAVNGAVCYRIKADRADTTYNFENPDFREWQVGSYWQTTETTYVRTLPAGKYDLYVEAYADSSNEAEPIKTSEKISIDIEDAEIHFKDPNFREYLKNYVLENNIYVYNSRLVKEDIFTFNDLPRSLSLSWTEDAYHEYSLPSDFNPTIYIENSENKNYEIYKYESITNDYSIRAGWNSNSFKPLGGITSVTEIGLDGVYNHNLIDNLSEFLGYFPNVKFINISKVTLKDCSVLTNLKYLEQNLMIQIEGKKEDLEAISKLDNITQLQIVSPYYHDIAVIPSIDLSNLSNMKNLTMLSIEGFELKDVKVNNPKIECLEINNCRFNGNNIINGLENLKTLSLYDNEISDNLAFNNLAVKELYCGCGESDRNFLNDNIFDGLTNLETLNLSGMHWYDYVTHSDYNWNNLEKLKNLKNLSIDCFHIDDLSFLEKLVNLESVGLSNVKGNKGLPSFKNLKNLREIYIYASDITDVTGLILLVESTDKKLKNVEFRENLFAPNSKKNQKLFDLLVKNNIEFHVDNYWIKDFISTAILINSISSPGLGVIEAFAVNHSTKIQDLITLENFPISETYDVNVISHGGAGKSLDENVGSKDKIQIVNTLGEILQEYTVIVPGDVTGNGEVKLYDAFKILNDSVKKAEIDEIDVEIRDYNDDGKVSTYDALQYMKETMKEQ